MDLIGQGYLEGSGCSGISRLCLTARIHVHGPVWPEALLRKSREELRTVLSSLRTERIFCGVWGFPGRQDGNSQCSGSRLKGRLVLGAVPRKKPANYSGFMSQNFARAMTGSDDKWNGERFLWAQTSCLRSVRTHAGTYDWRLK